MVIDQIVKYIEYLNISFNEFTRNLGLSNGYIGSAKKTKRAIGSDVIEKILRQYPDINPAWLMTGNGQMLNSKSNQLVSIEKHPQNAHENAHDLVSKQKVHDLLPLSVREDTVDYTSAPNPKRVPLLTSRSFIDPNNENDTHALDYYDVPGASGADFLMSFHGNSMTPIVSNGDVFAGKIIPKTPIFSWGRIHAAEVDGVGVIMGRLMDQFDSSDFILEPENKDYRPITIPVDDIIGLAICVAIVKIM